MKKLTLLVLLGASLFAEPKPSDAKDLGKRLMNNLPGIFSVDPEMPALRNGDWVITYQPISLIESFSENTQVIATLFIKKGDEFVRISTTEEGEKPGSILDHASPAYARMIGELRFTGKVTLAGKEYMADYDVFRDRPGRVIGAYLVAIPIDRSAK